MLGQYLKMGHSSFLSNLLTFSVQPFKCQVSAAATALFNLNTHSGTMFSLLDKRDVHLMGQHSLAFLLKVNLYHLFI